MPRKKSIKKAAKSFGKRADEITAFLAALPPGLSKDHTSWMREYAIIRLYRAFEALMLEALVGAINNDTQTLSDKVGVKFPRHLTDEVCEYLLVGEGYFDFKGRDGLIKEVRAVVPDNHYLLGLCAITGG